MSLFNRPLAYFFTLLLLGCASSSPMYTAQTESSGGIGGTGVIHPNIDKNGIGGTGKTLDEGIGGTGLIAQKATEGSGIGGTGIVGTITKFGSIWVNQAHVRFDESTPITINQSPATQGQLQLGQVVAVNSIQDGAAYQAKSIDIIHEVVGPISQLILEKRRLEVLNQTIHLSDEAIIYDQKSNSVIALEQLESSPYTHAHIEVSGLRQEDGDIIASRLDIVEPLDSLQLIGELKQSDDGLWQINHQTIHIDELLLFDDLSKRALISGHLEGEVFIADAIGTDSIKTVLEGVSEVIYEGYVFDMELEGMVNIGGLEFTVQDSLEITEEQYLQNPIQINALLAEDGFYEAHDLRIELEENGDFINLMHDEDIEHEALEFIDEIEWEQEVYYDEDDLNHLEGFEEDLIEMREAEPEDETPYDDEPYSEEEFYDYEEEIEYEE